MSVIVRLLSSGVARGIAALLAVLLSAVIGGRLGVDRLSLDLADDEHTPVACPLVADLVNDLPLTASISDLRLSFSEVRHRIVAGVPLRENPRPSVGLLRGSA